MFQFNSKFCLFSCQFSFAKFDLWSAGTEALDFLQYTCSNDVNIPVGKYILASGKWPIEYRRDLNNNHLNNGNN